MSSHLHQMLQLHGRDPKHGPIPYDTHIASIVTMEAAKHGEISCDPRYEALLTGRDAAAQSDDVCLHAYPA